MKIETAVVNISDCSSLIELWNLNEIMHKYYNVTPGIITLTDWEIVMKQFLPLSGGDPDVSVSYTELLKAVVFHKIQKERRRERWPRDGDEKWNCSELEILMENLY